MARRPSDKPAMIMRVERGGLVPAAAYDAEVLERFTLGSEVEVVVSQKKSNDQLRLYWGFLTEIADNQESFGSARALSNTLLCDLGYVESFTSLMGGGAHVHPMSLAEMDAPDFNQFVEKAFAVIREEFGMDVEDYKARQRAKAGVRW